MRTKSFEIPLGQSSTVYITPKATEIAESGMELSENQRNCRLEGSTENLNIYNIYTMAACLFECKLEFSKKRCGCLPWEYPFNSKEVHKVTDV